MRAPVGLGSDDVEGVVRVASSARKAAPARSRKQCVRRDAKKRPKQTHGPKKRHQVKKALGKGRQKQKAA